MKLNLIFIIVGFFALVIVGALIIGSINKNKAAEDTGYKRNDPNRPIAVLSEKKIDWGKIKLDDTKEAKIELKNDGNSPLEIKGLSTSCGCTGVKLAYNSAETPEYSMHLKLKEQIKIEPKTSATLTVIYRPFTMPVEGPVTRQVFIDVNDPQNPRLEIDARAVVEK